MLDIFFQLTLVLLPQLTSAALSQSHRRNDDPTIFNPPSVEPILHLVPIIDYPINSSDVFNVNARVANLGGEMPTRNHQDFVVLADSDAFAGNFSGIISGDVLGLGAATEVVLPESDGVKTFYTNTFSLNTTDGVVISMLAQGTIHYANNALHGFGSVSFETGDDQYRYLNYGGYAAEFAAVFGQYAFVDVFELGSNGRKDGEVVPALEPPGAVPA